MSDAPPEPRSNFDFWSEITWTPLPDGSVRQHWQESTDDGATRTTVFDGTYRRV